jgi:hypothetical protein
MPMPEWWSHLMVVLGVLIPLGLWCAWWLWGVNWKKAWPMLAAGGWAPVVLLMIVATLVWSRLSQGPWSLGAVVVPNVWWQLGGVCVLAAIALLCGWLQGWFGWTPAEISLEPPAEHDDHGHHEAHPSHNGPAHH